MRTAAIIAAGGYGTRLPAARLKQFVDLAGKPLLAHTVARFDGCDAIDEILLVLPRHGFDAHERFMRSWAPGGKPLTMVPGGDERQESVANGLAALPPSFEGLVAVHDGVRPLVSESLIRAVVEAAARFGCALPGLAVHETLKEVGDDGMVSATVDRRRLYRAQTPQCFRCEILRTALERARRDGFVGTDEAALVERLGLRVHLVPGSESNLKVTTLEDLALAEYYLERAAKKCTTG